MDRIVPLLIFTAFLSGCSNLIETKMMSSKSIFLTPGSIKTIYVQNRNMSENQDVSLNGLPAKLVTKGYRVLQDPAQANVLLQAKIVYCNEVTQTVSFETVLQGGFGSGIGSATSGSGDMGGMMGLIGAMMGGMPMGMAGGGRNIGGGMPMGMTGMPFGMGSMGMNAAPKDDTVLYFCAVDVQVTEQGKGTISSAAALPVSPRQEMTAGAMPGAPVGDNKNNQMRVVAGVRQKKLRVEEATPVIREELTTGIAGMF